MRHWPKLDAADDDVGADNDCPNCGGGILSRPGRSTAVTE